MTNFFYEAIKKSVGNWEIYTFKSKHKSSSNKSKR